MLARDAATPSAPARDAAEAFAAARASRPDPATATNDATPRLPETFRRRDADVREVRTRGVEWDEDVVAFVAMDDDDRRGAANGSRRGADRTRSGADAVPTGSPTMSSTLAPSVDASATARRRHRSSVSGVDGSIATGFGADLSSSCQEPESRRRDDGASRKFRVRRRRRLDGSKKASNATRLDRGNDRRGTTIDAGSGNERRDERRGNGFAVGFAIAFAIGFASSRASSLGAARASFAVDVRVGPGAVIVRVRRRRVRVPRGRGRVRTRATREPRGPNEREDVDDFPADPRRDDEREGGEDEPAARLGEMAKALEHVREEVRAVSVAAARGWRGRRRCPAGPSRDDGVSPPGTNRRARRRREIGDGVGGERAIFQNATDVLSRSVSMFRRDGSVAGDGDGGTRERIVELEATIESLRREWVDGEKVGALELAMDHAVEYLIPVGGVLIVGFTCFALAVAVIGLSTSSIHGNIETVSGDDGRMRTFLRRVLVGRLPFTFGASEDPPELVPT